MKSVQRILSIGAVVITLAVTSIVAVYSVAQDKKPSVPTRKELVTLLKTAKEPLSTAESLPTIGRKQHA
jgi:hypothetical protein